MSRNTRENPHRKLYTDDEIARLERYHTARQSYPLGGLGRRIEQPGSKAAGLGAMLAMTAMAGRKRAA